jgi:hypothetical protein
VKGVGHEGVDKETREEILLEITAERRIMVLQVFLFLYT